ncbi:MAG: thiamine phosphate synthase [Nitrososphaerota archaeon]|jgi:thiamine-phosphate pyrophosphorylase|nr:thiamine phosphate synthase [Nitrososphaerota archaeon]MDG6923720.1 thiamine phosphate synthase [Nitrososphaerota archaeon]
MKSNKRRIESGVYLVVDLSYGDDRVVDVAQRSMEGGLDILQLWASWKDSTSAIETGKRLAELADKYSVPFVVNGDIDVAMKIGADGVHINGVEPSPSKIRKSLGDNCIVGVTCSTNMDKVLWASREKVDYISFCSMYPSNSVTECDIVPLQMITEVRKRISVPIFASGGIDMSNAHEIIDAGGDGVATISMIMKSEDPKLTTQQLKDVVAKHRKPWPRITA